jgi:hypothetical protein
MAQVIPFRPSIGRYRFITVIDQVQYIFKVRWNSRTKAWYFDVLEADSTPIVKGVKIVLGVVLGRWSNHPLFIQGGFYVRSHAQVHEDATFDNLGTAVEVWYFTRGDLAQEVLATYSGA